MKEQKTTNNILPKDKDFELLRKHFSNFFDKNENFNFEKFKRFLSKNEDINFSKESYGMDWLGKSYARLLATDEATTLLREDEEWNNKEENQNSENLLIKGDNLEVLKHLSHAYHEKIKMIYIDPPYNTGGDGFVYQDDRKFTKEELSHLAGIDEEKAKRILEFTESKSNSHSAWLTFMYPRLYIAKQLLKDDGVVFISIDDNEVAQLSLLMDEIFGEENNEIITWKKIDPKYDKNTNAKIINRTKRIHEFILVGYSNKEETSFGKIKKLPQWKNKYKNMDNDPRGSYKQGIISFEEGHKKEDKNSEYYYTITLPSGRKMTRHFFVLKEEFEELVKDNRIYFPKNGDGVPALKIFENEKKEFYFDTILEGFGSMNSAKKEIAKIFEVDEKNVPFKTPKPTELLLEIIRAVASKNDIILDFFAGSGTTGDAVMKLNAEDGGNRKYILAQLPEVIDKKKKENKIAYDFVKNELNVENPTIFDITKERLIRAANKIKTENINNKITEKQKEIKELEGKLDLENKTKKINKIKDEIIALKNQDLGFKIFETIPNNEGKWENYVLKLEKFDPHQKLLDEYKLNKEDLKTLLTTWKTFDGFSLTQNLKEIDFDGYKGHYLDNKLYLVYKGFETRHLKKLLEEIDENRDFYPATIIAFGYNFESKMLREIEDNIKIYKNKKQIDIDFIVRY